MITAQRPTGVVRIFLYNWPTYLATWIGAAILSVVAGRVLPFPLAALGVIGAVIAVAWSAFSLLVSFYVYDRSPLVSGAWLAPFLPRDTRSWATVHAGLDAEIDLDRALPGACIGRLDIFDPSVMTAPSIRRARLRTAQAQASTSCKPTHLPLQDRSCDLIVVAFTAHEIRDTEARERFFAETHRALRVGGRMILVEHVQDLANFAAFGPGFLHFQTRGEWQRLAARLPYRVAHEARVTPFVMAISYQKVA